MKVRLDQYDISCDTCGAKCRYMSDTDRENWMTKHLKRYPGHTIRMTPKFDMTLKSYLSGDINA